MVNFNLHELCKIYTYIVLSVLVPIILCNSHNAQWSAHLLATMYSGKNRIEVCVDYIYVYIVAALNNSFDINGVPEIEVQLCIVIL